MADGFEKLPMLTVKIAGFEPRGSGSPVRELDWTDVAGAMGVLDEEQADILRALYLHEEAAAFRLRKRVSKELARWPDLPPMLHVWFVDAIFAAFIHMRACRKCGGAGFVVIPRRVWYDEDHKRHVEEKRHLVCDWCDGDGFDHVSASAVQLVLGVDADYWEMRLAAPFEAAYRYLRETHDAAKAEIQNCFE